MTIEFGVLSNHGALLCADSEETAEIRRSANKFEVSFDQRERAVIVGGAGPADHLDGVAALLRRDVFEASGTDIHKDLETRLKKTIRQYYADHILCWPTENERNANDFAILLATKLPLSSPALWVSHQTALRRITSFTAIGTGAAYAKSLLDAYFKPMHDPALISLVAIYILQRVKRDIPYCGRESHLHWLTHGGELCYISAETIAHAETLFQKYEKSTVGQFFSLLDIVPKKIPRFYQR